VASQNIAAVITRVGWTERASGSLALGQGASLLRRMTWWAVNAEDAQAIGARARMIRRRRGLSLEVVAGLAGITKTYLSMLELGQRGFNRRGLVEDLAEALGCSVADLAGQPYLPPDRATAEGRAALPGISLALNDFGPDEVPDVTPRRRPGHPAARGRTGYGADRSSTVGEDTGTACALDIPNSTAELSEGDATTLVANSAHGERSTQRERSRGAGDPP
jgi:transcriptional regulator with XRE-family HTH domain